MSTTCSWPLPTRRGGAWVRLGARPHRAGELADRRRDLGPSHEPPAPSPWSPSSRGSTSSRPNGTSSCSRSSHTSRGGRGERVAGGVVGGRRGRRPRPRSSPSPRRWTCGGDGDPSTSTTRAGPWPGDASRVGGRLVEVTTTPPVRGWSSDASPRGSAGRRLGWRSSLDQSRPRSASSPSTGARRCGWRLGSPRTAKTGAARPGCASRRPGSGTRRVPRAAGPGPARPGRLQRHEPAAAARCLAGRVRLRPGRTAARRRRRGPAVDRVPRRQLLGDGLRARWKPLPGRAATHVPWIFVDDLDAHLARAEAAGARIVEPIHRHGYRAYVAGDPEGHCWTFVQARPTMR